MKLRILVLGGNGYIGNAVAVALRVAGHSVSGLVRTEEQRSALERDEIQVVVGDGLDAALVGDLMMNHDVAISCIESKDFAKLRAVFDAVHRLEKHFIFMGGCLDYGDHPNVMIDETTTCNGYYAETRVATFEKPILDLGAVVLRPGFVYGKSFGNYASSWFISGSNPLTIDGKRDRFYGFIHIDDLAAAVAALLKVSWKDIQGEVFDLTDSTKLSYEQIRILFAKTAGFTGEFLYSDETSWPAGNISCLSTGKKIQRVTGWAPTHGPLQEEIQIGFRAFVEHKKSK